MPFSLFLPLATFDFEESVDTEEVLPPSDGNALELCAIVSREGGAVPLDMVPSGERGGVEEGTDDAYNRSYIGSKIKHKL